MLNMSGEVIKVPDVAFLQAKSNIYQIIVWNEADSRSLFFCGVKMGLTETLREQKLCILSAHLEWGLLLMCSIY